MMLHFTSGREPLNNNQSIRHIGVSCDNCKLSNFTGIRYKCSVCPDYDLCDECIIISEKCDIRIHPQNHLFLRISQSINEVQVKPPLVQNRENWRHEGIACSSCGIATIVGFRYTCTSCAISFCEECEQSGLSITSKTPCIQ
jgi:hypothetical protein